MNRLWILVVLSLVVSAQAGSVLIVGENLGEYATIGEAISKANNGDEIVVSDGIYTGDGNRDLDFVKNNIPLQNITLRSEHGPSKCIIDCQGSVFKPHRAFDIESGGDLNLVIQGFTIINGYSKPSNNPFDGNGGAIFSLRPVTILNCIFAGNTASYGGAVAMLDGVIENCTFNLNRAKETGGAILVGSNGELSLVNSILWGNDAPIEAEVGLGQASKLIDIRYCDIEGGIDALKALGSVIVIDDKTFAYDPCFAEVGSWDNNNTGNRDDDVFTLGDYHLKSKIGRWDPNQSTWIKDSVWSPCVDAGEIADPIRKIKEDSPLRNELWPHGRRLNIGAYGGTLQASLSPSGVDMGDLNLDGFVDAVDIQIVGDQMNMAGLLKGDLDRNGVVNKLDMAAVSMRWNINVVPQTAPKSDADYNAWKDQPDEQLTWAVEPNSTGPGQIDMSATTFYSATGNGVEYFFEEIDHLYDSNWISFLVGQPIFWRDPSDALKNDGQTYCYRVKARDAGNHMLETPWAKTVCVGNYDPDPDTELWPNPPKISMERSNGAIVLVSERVYDTNEAEVTYYFAHWLIDWKIEGKEYKRDWSTKRTYTLPTLAEGTYRFSVKARSKTADDTGWSEILEVGISSLDTETTQWKQKPTHIAPAGTITMEAKPVVDSLGAEVEYYFAHLVSGSQEGNLSRDWDTSPEYSIAEVGTGSYRFAVKARSVSAGKNMASSEETVAISYVVPSATGWDVMPVQLVPGDTGFAIGTISMKAENSIDSAGQTIEYRFAHLIFGGQAEGVYTRDWGVSGQYTKAIQADGEYAFAVSAKSSSSVETTPSAIATVYVDKTPPIPDQMLWAAKPKIVGYYNEMLAVVATDASGIIEYYFERTDDTRYNSGWVSNPYFKIYLGPTKAYIWHVKARDKFGNETQWSDPERATY